MEVIDANNPGIQKYTFAPTDEIYISLQTGVNSRISVLTLLVKDQSRNRHLYEIPVLLDSRSGKTLIALKRPLSGWLEGNYQIVAQTIIGNVITSTIITISQ